MYSLDSYFATSRFTATVIGCGGTGGFVAEGLCRILPPRADLILVDHDRVEERNLGRQNFTGEDLGRFKSQALATRLARRYRRPVGYSVFPVAVAELKSPGLVIGCVDNGLARRDIAHKVAKHTCRNLWWVDAGNGANYGQVLIGSATLKELRRLPFAFDPETAVCHVLPLPTLQRPELLLQAPPGRDCAGAVAEGVQGPAINQAMAALVVEVARRLIEGNCPWMQLYLDLEAGTLVPVAATPQAVARVTGISRRRLVKRLQKEGGEPHGHQGRGQGGHRPQGQ